MRIHSHWQVPITNIVECKRERTKKLNCLSIQEKENFMPTTKAGPEAEYQCRALILGMGQARPMGAGEAGGGR